MSETERKESVLDVLNRIRAEQEARGHVARTAEEIDAEIRELREEWEDRYREIEAIQEECYRRRTAQAEANEGTQP